MQLSSIGKYPAYTPVFWSAYFVQMRPYLLFISGIAGLAGISLNADPGITGWKFIVSSMLFFFAYGFGQALTDCFQTDTDKLSAPYRPLSREIISVKNVFIISLLFLLATGILFYLLNPYCFWLSMLAVIGLATYSWVKKKAGIAGPFYNAWIVSLLPLMGYLSCSDHSTIPAAIWPYILITFFSYANFVLIGYLKDIEADKQTGYKTFPVVFGWDRTVVTGDVFALITLLAAWFIPYATLTEWLVRVLASIIIVAGQVYAHLSKNKDEKDALIPILATVRGFILIHISIILHFQPGWLIGLCIFYALFEITLYKRPSKYQV